MEGICKRKACFWILLIWKSASDKNSHTPCNFFQLLPLMKNLQCAHTRWYKYRDLPFLWDVPRYCRWFEIPDDWFFCSLFYFSLFFSGYIIFWCNSLFIWNYTPAFFQYGLFPLPHSRYFPVCMKPMLPIFHKIQSAIIFFRKFFYNLIRDHFILSSI